MVAQEYIQNKQQLTGLLIGTGLVKEQGYTGPTEEELKESRKTAKSLTI